MNKPASNSESLFKNSQFIAVWTVGILVGIVRWLEFLAVGIYGIHYIEEYFKTDKLTNLPSNAWNVIKKEKQDL